MKFEVPFKEIQVKYILSEFKDAKIIRKKNDLVWIELDIQYNHHILNLFFAGVYYGFKNSQ